LQYINLELRILNLAFAIYEFGTQNFELGIKSSKYGTRNSELGIMNSEFGTQNFGIENWN
jgi:hypothetical protein